VYNRCSYNDNRNILNPLNKETKKFGYIKEGESGDSPGLPMKNVNLKEEGVKNEEVHCFAFCHGYLPVAGRGSIILYLRDNDSDNPAGPNNIPTHANKGADSLKVDTAGSSW
jgi:hypothetical protein